MKYNLTYNVKIDQNNYQIFHGKGVDIEIIASYRIQWYSTAKVLK